MFHIGGEPKNIINGFKKAMDVSDGCGGTNINPQDRIDPVTYKIKHGYSGLSYGIETSIWVPKYKDIPHDATYKTTTTNEMKDLFENFYNVGGGEIIDAQQTNKNNTKRNSRVDTWLGFASDGKQGADSEFVITDDGGDISQEFIQQLDTDGKNGVSKTEYMNQMRIAELERKSVTKEGGKKAENVFEMTDTNTDGIISEDEYMAQNKKLEDKDKNKTSEDPKKTEKYYGQSIVQYSDKKAQASFNAMDANNDGQIDQTESSEFFHGDPDKNIAPKLKKRDDLEREENGQQVTHKNLLSISFNDLPQEMKDATITGTTEKTIDKKAWTEKNVPDGFKESDAKSYGTVPVDTWEITDNIGKKDEAILEDEATLIETIGKLQAENGGEKVPVGEVYALMEKMGMPKDKTQELLDKYLSVGIKNKELKDDATRIGLKPEEFKKFQKEENVQNIVSKMLKDPNNPPTWASIYGAVREANVYEPREYGYSNQSTFRGLVHQALGLSSEEMTELTKRNNSYQETFKPSEYIQSKMGISEKIEEQLPDYRIEAAKRREEERKQQEALEVVTPT